MTMNTKPKRQPKANAIKESKPKPEIPHLTTEQKAMVINAVRYSKKSIGAIAKELNVPKSRVQEAYNAWLWPKGVPDIVKKHART